MPLKTYVRYTRYTHCQLNVTRFYVAVALQVVRYTARLQEMCSDSDGIRTITDYCHRKAHSGCTLINADAFPADAGLDAAAAAAKVLEGISFLEAVTVSPVFVCVIAAYEGVPALLRALAATAATKMMAPTAGKATAFSAAAQAIAGGGRGRAGSVNARNAPQGGAARGVSLTLADEVLSRTCNTLAHLARVAYEIAGGQVEVDPEYEPVDAASFGIGEQVCGRALLASVGGRDEVSCLHVPPPPYPALLPADA
jgi:hypothetical protein